ncbi:hypothetical protein GSA37_004639 [Salmonella enterica]|uniref:Uncharacterized protein n=1 Tax=Salmonella enterica subsp. enterica serovar Javiana TaxID=363569 RepID=A0A733V9S2_SALET|nr:hypothetical protein [Salmonella enterica subsp. enterica serovar Javiana]EBA9399158.1 hypothetical protein [Salmonella enterica]EBY8517532.1 hypothetical protein [Salmonella enterica subsp. enterica serovar Braenderup]ECD6765809.1 hypothetical protein [Salmonella enterica subsp. enterica serovar Newport]EHE0685173.1 hypothetical protein [Salmonella enterica subsp. enterica serovar Eastbourne]
MATPATVSIEPTLAAIRARWCFNSSKTTQSFNDPASMEEVVEYLKGTYSALRKSVACAKLKILHLKQRMQNATNFLARLMSCKNQASRSHHSTAKSAKSALSSDSGDGNDPDPEPETFPSAFITTPTNSIMLKAFFANISITEVAK